MSRLSEIEATLVKARAEVKRLCEVPGSKWQMRIPVDLETDSDVLIGHALRDAATLLRLVRELQDALEDHECFYPGGDGACPTCNLLTDRGGEAI